jgi:hypothetical protein
MHSCVSIRIRQAYVAGQKCQPSFPAKWAYYVQSCLVPGLDIFCVPMTRCLKMIERSGRGVLDRLFAKLKNSYICFSVKSEWRCRHKAHQAARRSRVFTPCLPFLFLPRTFFTSKTSIIHGLTLVCAAILNGGLKTRRIAKP